MPIRQKLRQKNAVPLYVAMPSVRPSIQNALCKWFTHALEARMQGGTADVLRHFNPVIAAENDLTLKNQ